MIFVEPITTTNPPGTIARRFRFNLLETDRKWLVGCIGPLDEKLLITRADWSGHRASICVELRKDGIGHYRIVPGNPEVVRISAKKIYGRYVELPPRLLRRVMSPSRWRGAEDAARRRVVRFINGESTAQKLTPPT